MSFINEIDYRGCTKSAWIGKSRSGKSVTASIFAKALLESKLKDHIIVHDPQSRFKDVQTGYINSIDELDKFIKKEKGERTQLRITNALFVFDECQMLLGSGRTPQALLDLLALGSEYGVEFIFITHHPQLIPPRVAMYLTHFFIFTTGSGTKSFEDDRIEGVETLAQVKEIVTAYVKKYPKGGDGLGIYPNFPFAFVETNKEKVKFINMPEIEVNNGIIKM